MKGEKGRKGDQGIPVRYYHIVLKILQSLGY